MAAGASRVKATHGPRSATGGTPHLGPWRFAALTLKTRPHAGNLPPPRVRPWGRAWARPLVRLLTPTTFTLHLVEGEGVLDVGDWILDRERSHPRDARDVGGVCSDHDRSPL